MKRWWLFILGVSLVVIVAVFSPQRIDVGSLQEKDDIISKGSNLDKPEIVSIRSKTSIEKNREKKNFVPREVKMDRALWKELNRFFSIFVVHGLNSFSRDKIDEESFISFAANFIAFDGRVPREWREWGDGKKWGLPYDRYCKIPAKYVELIVKKYFDRKIEKHQHPAYKEGYYYVSWGCAEGDSNFAQVTKLMEIGDNEFLAKVNIYSSESWPGKMIDLPPSEWERFRGKKDEFGDEYEIPQLERKMIATIRKVGSDNQSRYVLVEYLEDKELDPNEPKIVFLRKEKALYEGECRYDEADWRGLANAWVVGIDGKNPIKITSSPT